MKRMKTFLIYALIFIGFFAFSMFLENGLLNAMYKDISGSSNGAFEGTDDAFGIENVTANATNVNGNVQFDLVNNSGKSVDQGYIKLDLYNSQNQNAATKYIPIEGLEENGSKKYNVKFKANNIEGYKISVVKDLPDKTNIIDILGWEIDLSNLFGLGIDLTNMSIFGKNINDIISSLGLGTDGITGAVSTVFDWWRAFWVRFSITAASVPPWAYLIAMMYIAGIL